MTATDSPRICVIGAGPCGLTTVKNLLAQGLTDVACYDEGDAIGGNWNFTENPERVSVYESTHLISSKSYSGFEDFPMPENYPDFPSHRQMLAYFESYAAHFKLLPFIHLRTRVENAVLREDGRWTVNISEAGGRREEAFDFLLICSGHHRDPYIPAYPGSFAGTTMHSRDFKRPEPFRGKRVLVVGAGNSACDIAVDVSRVAARTCLSMRRGYYLIPKLVFGRPIDVLYARCKRRLPRWLLQPVLGGLLRLSVGPYEKYGLRQPDCGPLEMHPTLNSNILLALRHGTVTPRPGIERLEGNEVYFSDGSNETFDTIIFGTGFRIAFPFLDRSLVNWDANRPPPLYLKMMDARTPALYFIGLFQPIGCIWRLADFQARIAALQIAGRLDRPSALDQKADREMHAPHWHYNATPRHAVEVDYHDFRAALLTELAAARG